MELIKVSTVSDTNVAWVVSEDNQGSRGIIVLTEETNSVAFLPSSNKKFSEEEMIEIVSLMKSVKR